MRKFPHSFSIAYTKLSMLLRLLACHPANFIGENTTVQGSDTFPSNCGYKVDPFWFSLSLGYQVDVSPRFSPSPSQCARSAPFLIISLMIKNVTEKWDLFVAVSLKVPSDVSAGSQ